MNEAMSAALEQLLSPNPRIEFFAYGLSLSVGFDDDGDITIADNGRVFMTLRRSDGALLNCTRREIPEYTILRIHADVLEAIAR